MTEREMTGNAGSVRRFLGPRYGWRLDQNQKRK